MNYEKDTYRIHEKDTYRANKIGVTNGSILLAKSALRNEGNRCEKNPIARIHLLTKFN